MNYDIIIYYFNIYYLNIYHLNIYYLNIYYLMAQIPFVIIFNTNNNKDKISDDIYNSVTKEYELELKVVDIFKKLMIENEFVVINHQTQKYELNNSVKEDLLSHNVKINELEIKTNKNKTKILYELFCERINAEPYDTSDLFAFSYFTENKWFMFDTNDLNSLFNYCYNQMLKE